jgi:REP element-mobilizing transposase RayT
MEFNDDLYKNKYRIKSARYEGYDYSQLGYYFVTICTAGREMYFGEVISENCLDYNGDISDASVALTEMGKIANKFWLEIPRHFPNVILDEYIIMPNHVHGIIIIDKNRRDEAMPRLYEGDFPQMSKISPKPQSLSVIVGSYKSICTKIININFLKSDFSWQPRFYDRIIRHEEELNNIRNYIINNPIKWALDRNNPKNIF